MIMKFLHALVPECILGFLILNWFPRLDGRESTDNPANNLDYRLHYIRPISDIGPISDSTSEMHAVSQVFSSTLRAYYDNFCCDLAQVSSPHWQNMEQREAYQRLIETLSVLRRLATRLSSRAEVVGAVRQVHLTRTLADGADLRKRRPTHRRQRDRSVVYKTLPSPGCRRANGSVL